MTVFCVVVADVINRHYTLTTTEDRRVSIDKQFVYLYHIYLFSDLSLPCTATAALHCRARI